MIDGRETGFVVVMLLLSSIAIGAAEPVTGAPSEETMTQQQRIDFAAELMTAFAERTGLGSDLGPDRYLWTDAYAVCNFLGLAQTTGDERYRRLALNLIEQVHVVLGQHREDDPRCGWLDGASEEHPTLGGLRIGKSLPERKAGEPANEREEWDRDGQYFHYLTKWMHALDQAARVTGRAELNLWARELAETAHKAFTHPASGGGKRMYWKMSIDLSRPLVPSMGHHDPLDGYVTAVQLLQTAADLDASPDPQLESEAADYAAMIENRDMTTDDPLGLGGLLVDAYRVEQLMRKGRFRRSGLLENLLTAAFNGIQRYDLRDETRVPADYRLGFRELGLAIGLAGVERMGRALDSGDFAGDEAARARLEALLRHVDMGEEIMAFWLEADHRQGRTWTQHRNINDVMLATSLLPDRCITLSGD